MAQLQHLVSESDLQTLKELRHQLRLLRKDPLGMYRTQFEEYRKALANQLWSEGVTLDEIREKLEILTERWKVRAIELKSR